MNLNGLIFYCLKTVPHFIEGNSVLIYSWIDILKINNFFKFLFFYFNKTISSVYLFSYVWLFCLILRTEQLRTGIKKQNS